MANSALKIISTILIGLMLFADDEIMGQTWSYTYTYTDNNNWVNSALGIEATSYGYLVVTFSRPFIDDSWQQILIFRNLDLDGNEISNQSFAVPNSSILGTQADILHKTTWGTFLVSGSIHPIDTDYEETGQSFLIELDEWGNILNTYTHETGYPNLGTCAMSLDDGSIVVGGHTTYAGSPFNDAWATMLFKLTPEWELDWDYAYLQSQIRAYEMFSLTTDQDGNIFLGGRIFILNSSGCVEIPNVGFDINSVIIKTDQDGIFNWKREYGGCNWQGPAFVSSSQDNSIIVASGTKLEGGFSEGFDWWYHRQLLRIDPEDGVPIWETNVILDDAWDGIFRKALELSSSNIITCGYDQAIEEGFRGELALFSSEGDSLWMRPYMFEGNLEGWFEDVIPAIDGGYVASGRVFPNGTGIERSWVIKVDEYGCLVPGCHLVGVEESKEEFPWSIGPNPTVDQLYVFVGANPGHNASLELYDLQGRWIKSVGVDPSKGVTYILDMGSLPIGQYILKLVTNNGVWSEKVVKGL